MKKWRARAGLLNKTIYIGYFDKLEDAELAVKKFRKELGYTDDHGL